MASQPTLALENVQRLKKKDPAHPTKRIPRYEGIAIKLADLINLANQFQLNPDSNGANSPQITHIAFFAGKYFEAEQPKYSVEVFPIALIDALNFEFLKGTEGGIEYDGYLKFDHFDNNGGGGGDGVLTTPPPFPPTPPNS